MLTNKGAKDVLRFPFIITISCNVSDCRESPLGEWQPLFDNALASAWEAMGKTLLSLKSSPQMGGVSIAIIS